MAGDTRESGLDLAGGASGGLWYVVKVGEGAESLSCNEVVLEPHYTGFTNSWASQCLWQELTWWNEGYAYRQPLRIDAGKQVAATGTSAVQIPLGLVFDTEALIEQGKLSPDGRDLRVVYWGASGWDELPREIQGLNTITSTIWFPMRDALDVGQSGDYYVYYGNPWAGEPEEAITEVFGTSTKLVAHLNGETTGSEGEVGTIGGSGFSWGEEESGYRPGSMEGTSTLTYTQSGNIEPDEGSIALQVKPSLEPDDGSTHYLFQAGQAGGDRLELYKNSAGQMRFKVVAGGQSYEVSEVADLAAGAWGSVVATWDDGGGSAHLYQNGDGTNSAAVTNSVSGTLGIWLGSQAGGGSSVEAEMANLFIYDQTMSKAQAESQHRAQLWTDIQPGDKEYNATSTITITYDYDPLYRLTSASYSAGAEYEYTYDAVGNRQTMTTADGETSYTYNAANRLTSVGGVVYTWDDNGNLTSDGVRSYTYDHGNRLTQVTEGSLTTQFAYNGDGVRTSKTVGADTTEYALDLLATLPVVISDTDAVYLYGLDIIAQQQSERLYYVHDGLGSVRQLVDSMGDVETNYAYDPFGVPVVEGDESNPYQYTGEAWDAEVGLLYLRARYYQPGVGRFISKDPLAADRRRPATLGGYAYVGNNAINLVDPSGNQGCLPTHRCPPLDTRVLADAEELERDYGILVGKEYLDIGHQSFEYALWSDWTADQLDLVLKAVGDFASDMDRREAAFRARMAPVRLYKRPGELDVYLRPQGGLTTPWSITLSGLYWDNKEGMKWVIVHEFAHWWDGKEGAQLSGQMWAGRFWEVVSCDVPLAGAVRLRVREWREDRPTDLLNPREDWAESVAAYVYPDYAGGPDRLKEISRTRWDYVARYMNPGSPKPYPEKWDNYQFKSVQL